MRKKIKPMLATLVEEPFDDKNWLFETKWDGYRCIADVADQEVSLYSRNFKPQNHLFPPIVKALQALHIDAILDGEIVVIDTKGISHFQSLQNYQRSGVGDLRYCLFDILFYQGKDLRSLPLIKRKEILKKLLPSTKRSALYYSEHVLERGVKLYTAASKMHLEGIMAKEIHSPYRSMRSRSWLKIKTHARQEAVIAGFTEPRGSRKKFGALIVGVYEKGSLQYIGHVGGGFDAVTLDEVMKKMEPLITPKCPFKIAPVTNMPVTWIAPKLVCEISFAEWTEEGLMRQPIFMGLRSDKKPKDVIREVPHGNP